MRIRYAILTLFILAIAACRQSEHRPPTVFGGSEETDTAEFSLGDIMEAGDLIIGTISGPETYYQYRDRGFGLQFELAELFAQSIGTRLRVEVATDTVQLLDWLREGEVDLLALPLPKTKGTLRCRNEWLVDESQGELAEAIDDWYSPKFIDQLKNRQKQRTGSKAVRRRARPQMLNRKKGVISRYDAIFQRHAASIGWDWRLLAAQCWQESAFDPNAVSWAGARGLMQIMPATGALLGLRDVWNPEQNIAAAVKYLGQLNAKFRNISERSERINFVLAAYNGGYGHVSDAQALAQKHGANPKRWRDVEPYILKLQQKKYYTDPVVKHGYMIGSETANYVKSINNRWRQYCGNARPYYSTPSPSGRKNTKVRSRDEFVLKTDTAN